MELLVMAGIPPIDAIKMCTSNAAKILRRDEEFGSLQVGLSADIVLVAGNPAENINESRNVTAHGATLARVSSRPLI